MMACNAALHPDELVCDLLAKGFAELCYDGKPFPASDHPVEDADGVASSVSNMQAGAGDARSPLDTSRPVKPPVFQTRVPCTSRQLDRDSDNHVVFRDEYVYGNRARVNAGFALCQLAFGSRDTLDVTNHALARAAMQEVRYDGGRIIGVAPTLLVVPPSLEAGARQVLKALEIEGGPNIRAGSAGLPVTPCPAG